MAMRAKALIAWSSGKDSAWALHEARRTGEFDIVGAVTTVTDTFGRVSMHGVREELLLRSSRPPSCRHRGAHPVSCPNEIYEQKMAAAMADAKAARHHAHYFRRSLSAGRARLSREKSRRHRHYAGVSLMGTADGRAGAPQMIEAGVEAHLTVGRFEKIAGCVRRPPLRFGLLDALARRHRPVRRERRIPFLCVGRADAEAENCGARRRDGRARWLCVCGFVAGNFSSEANLASLSLKGRGKSGRLSL